jgi:hypothetical protein
MPTVIGLFSIMAFVCLGFIDLVEFGLVNGTGQNLYLLAEYNSGRKVDLPLRPHQRVLMRGLLWEKLVRIRVSRPNSLSHSCEIARLLKTKGSRGNRWLYITSDSCRFLTDEEKKRLD